MLMCPSSKFEAGLVAMRRGDRDARTNIKTGTSAEANFRPLSCVSLVMNAQQVPGVVMGYGGLPPKVGILLRELVSQNRLKWLGFMRSSGAMLCEWIK
jgi:hypothetical protein